MRSADYNNQMFKQIEELMNKCESLSNEIKRLKKEHKVEVDRLNNRINVLETENSQLKTDIRVLRDDNDRLKKIVNNDSNNSSKPPSTDIKADKKIPNNREKSNKNVGGQLNHKPYNLSKKHVEEKIKTGELKHKIVSHGKKTANYKSKYILDVQIVSIAEEHRFYADENGQYNIPEEFATDVQYGTNLKSLCTTLNIEEYVAIDRITSLINNLTNEAIRPSKGSIVNFIQEANNKSQYILDKMKEKILNSSLMHTDATVSRCNSKNQSVRDYSTDDITLLVGTPGKSKKYLEETNILPQYTGNIVHDHETVIYNYGNKHGECNVHVLRYLKGCYENTKHKWAKDLRSFLCCLNNSKKKLQVEGKCKFEQVQLERLSKRYDEIIESGIDDNKHLTSKYYRNEEKRLLNRLKKYKDNHLLFAYDFSIPFDNNLSERDLRHVKSKLKVAGCFRSEEGMQNYLNIRSIIGTCRKKAMNFYTIIKDIYKNIPVEI